MTTTLPTNIDKWIRNNLFDAVPMAIAVIDRNYDIIHANKSFEQVFGIWRNRKCHAVYKNKAVAWAVACKVCNGREVFKDGLTRVNEEVGFNRYGRLTRYIQHIAPIKDENGKVEFIVEVVSEIDLMRREHQLLFDQVPCSVLIINRDYRIVNTNLRIRQQLGDITGEFCYKALKGYDEKCVECTAHQTFSDGEIHYGSHVWAQEDGGASHVLVTTVPLRKADQSIEMVMEMAIDVTKTLKLEDELKVAYTFFESIIDTALDGIIALDDKNNVTIINTAARRIFRFPGEQIQITGQTLSELLPPGFFEKAATGTDYSLLHETEVKTIDGDLLPVRLICTQLKREDRFIGIALYIEDLTHIKKLEKEKLEVERLAAVGQTVAGLAHGVKNLINALEGGMYLLKSGIDKNRMDRVSSGMDMLIRNIERVSMFVKEFLAFSKGREIRVKMEDPAAIAHDVVELYAGQAAQHGVELRYESPGSVSSAPMDFEGIHECLTNLVGNAIDACDMSDKKKGRFVAVRIAEKNDAIVFEVHDNGIGMDYDVKQKVFTNFFTTKGLSGAGLGLLTTKKIVQEHGGSITFTSEPGEGSTFSIHLPRKRLPQQKSSQNA
jgi:PAS domain S-box-containing protein